jgi:calcium-dependent protein kinase
VFEDNTDVHMVMELCEGPSLTDAIAAGRLINEQDIAIVMSSILRFIAQCHGKGLVYRDVKPDNFIFVRNDCRSPLKATDFGLSIKHRSGESPLTSRSGTPAYMAPEVFFSAHQCVY